MFRHASKHCAAHRMHTGNLLNSSPVPMTTDTPVNTNADILHIYEGWHQAVVNRDLESLMRLYATDALFETPLILAVMPDRSEGILRGSSAYPRAFSSGFSYARQWPRALVPERHLFLRRPATDLGISAPDPAWRSG